MTHTQGMPMFESTSTQPAARSDAEPNRSLRGRRDMYRRAGAVLVLATILFPALALAQAASRPPLGPAKSPHGVTWGELALLPEYCRDAMGVLYGDQYFNKSPRADYWISLVGVGFWNIHHYCYALANIRRADAAGVDRQRRNYLYRKALADYYYMVNNSPPNLPLAPEIYTKMGEAYIALNDLLNASAVLERARELRPDYWPAYARWIDVLLKLNRRKDAAELARLGLRYAPKSDVLRRQYIAGGGDPASLRALPDNDQGVVDEGVSKHVTSVPSASASSPVPAGIDPVKLD